SVGASRPNVPNASRPDPGARVVSVSPRVSRRAERLAPALGPLSWTGDPFTGWSLAGVSRGIHLPEGADPAPDDRMVRGAAADAGVLGARRCVARPSASCVDVGDDES